MKQTNAMIAIALLIGTFSNNFNAEASSSTESPLITWTQSALYNTYRGMISSATGLISIPYSIMNVVGAWSDQQKIATAAIASFLAVYQIKRLIDRLTTTKDTRQLLRDIHVEEIPRNQYYSKETQQRIHERLKNK